MEFLYKTLLKPVAFALDPEFVHDRFTDLGELLGKTEAGRALVRTMYGYKGPDISKTVDGITYRTPIMLSAGFDYNGRLSQVLDCMGFGAEEVGSVTLHPCEGNEKPRLRRAIKSKSIVVYKGLRNEGVDAVIQRLASRKVSNNFVVGVSIARTNDACTLSTEDAIADYRGSLEKLVAANVGDYYTINISCPNAYDGENFANSHRLPELLSSLKQVAHSKPMYVKMPINLPWEEFKELIDIIRTYNLQGVIIGNLNKNYEDADYREEVPLQYRGGLSGKPCKALSDTLIEKTREHVGQRWTIIGTGGILSPKDAIDKFERGADLIQLITGMIMEGPHLISSIATAYNQYVVKTCET